mgnify:CR=1 FL=1
MNLIKFISTVLLLVSFNTFSQELELKDADSLFYNENYAKSKRVFSEDFDVVVDGNIIVPEKESDVQDDQRFNTEKHHKQQHKF